MGDLSWVQIAVILIVVIPSVALAVYSVNKNNKPVDSGFNSLRKFTQERALASLACSQPDPTTPRLSGVTDLEPCQMTVVAELAAEAEFEEPTPTKAADDSSSSWENEVAMGKVFRLIPPDDK